jgi:UDP-N-acetylmuramate--alanine ligase
MDAQAVLSKNGAKIYCVGIKGTGTAALAELLHETGFAVSGSDGPDVFYTDAILKDLGIPYYENFDPSHVPADADLVVHSAAYNDSNCEIAQAKKLNLPVIKYTDALGAYSALFDSSAIAGVHGKTTTTAITGTLLRAAGVPARVLAGSAVANFSPVLPDSPADSVHSIASAGRSTLNLGSQFFVAETCEYRRHFLAFHPRRIVLTSVESDHQDYYPTYADIRDAFVEYAGKLPPGGALIYCADDPGASEVAKICQEKCKDKQQDKGKDIQFIPYGFTAPGRFQITSYTTGGERSRFTLAGFPGEWRLRIPGRHIVLDAAAAIALTVLLEESILSDTKRIRSDTLQNALESFSGSRRRSEILGEAGGILFMDDYGHHPTAVAATLSGLKEFYPDRRLIVSFMSHTYTRTAALLDEFAASLKSADIVFLHKIYPSARETYSGGVTGKTLFEKTAALRENVYYVEEPEDAAAQLKQMLKPGDLFITMGAGDNWKLGRLLFDYFRGLP